MLKADVVLDCLGLYCPMPIIKTAEKMKTLQKGQILHVIADDPGIVEDMPNWCKTTGQELLHIEKNNDEYSVFVKKTI